MDPGTDVQSKHAQDKAQREQPLQAPKALSSDFTTMCPIR